MVVDGQKQVGENPTVAVVLHLFHFSDKSGNMFELLDASRIWRGTCHNFLRKGPDRNLKPSRSEATVLSIYLFIARQAAVVFMAWTDTLHI